MKYMLRTDWWKWLTMAVLLYVFVGGLLLPVPRLPILNETIRVLYFHVPMWFGMIALFTASCIQAIRYLAKEQLTNDIFSVLLAEVGILFGILGMISGMFWANYTWGEPWSSDPKQNMSAIALLIYFAYFVLRGSIKDEQQRAKISAVYNIFAFATLIPLLFILPRLAEDSLHPGNGGNPGFNAYDLDSQMRLVFYPAVIGWALLGFWLATIKIRYELVSEKLGL
ncbi:MAG: cytochrome c biogenesis protein CcsA [Cyclobacteriaceae bacterium]|nr:cytochrome c biogenesis protein CcsA [Cyclobacteriaceae bacterium SS2]